MTVVLLRYRSREITEADIALIKKLIRQHYSLGRSHIALVLCQHWEWKQANGNYKAYAARDLLLRLEEKGFIQLPPRLRPKNNKKAKSFGQIPIFRQAHLEGIIGQYPKPIISDPLAADVYLWDYLVHHYHFLGLPVFVGEYLKYLIHIDGQVVACIGWSSAAFRVKERDLYIGWDEPTRKQRLHLIANNCRYLILPWIRIKHLASMALSLNLKRLSADWQKKYGHPLYLAESFVDISRFEGICYKASNWSYVGLTKGSAKKGNDYHYHGQKKGVYLYPLHRHYRRLLNSDQG